jgi:hypothetical protein
MATRRLGGQKKRDTPMHEGFKGVRRRRSNVGDALHAQEGEGCAL